MSRSKSRVERAYTSWPFLLDLYLGLAAVLVGLLCPLVVYWPRARFDLGLDDGVRYRDALLVHFRSLLGELICFVVARNVTM